jgi:hypothetical protein
MTQTNSLLLDLRTYLIRALLDAGFLRIAAYLNEHAGSSSKISEKPCKPSCVVCRPQILWEG